MRKAKLIVTSLCLVGLLALASPTAAYGAEEGPQGGTNSTKGAPPPPPPPPPGGGGLIGALIAMFWG